MAVGPKPRRELISCKAGRHWWVDAEDAAKCCNGWHRELRVGVTDGKYWYRHVWVKNDPSGQ